MSLIEENYSDPILIPQYEGSTTINSQIVGILRLKSSNFKLKNSKQPIDFFVKFTGNRVQGNRVILGQADYEYNHPFTTKALLFKVPEAGKASEITAWFESSRTGTFPNKRTKVSDKHSITKLNFKRVN